MSKTFAEHLKHEVEERKEAQMNAEYFQAKAIECDDAKAKVLHEVSYVINGVERIMKVVAECPMTAIDKVKQYLGG
jgi:hypothetical protein